VEDKRAIAGLWAVPGIGPKNVVRLAKKFRLADIEDALIAEWVREADLPTYARERIPRGQTLGQIGDWLLDRARQQHMKIAWLGEPEYPARLAEIRDPPPMLFYWGPGTDAAPRKRVAIVGSRQPDSQCLPGFRRIIRDTARHGVGVVSGAAAGIDTLAHTEAAGMDGETWAFVGSALDELDYHQRKLWEALEPKKATFWSELPPGVRAERKTFPRRNRLISGASDAVCVLRGRARSGARHTVRYAWEQGRQVLAASAELDNPHAELCNKIINGGGAQLLLSVTDILAAVGVSGRKSEQPPSMAEEQTRVDVSMLSRDAKAAFAIIERQVTSFDDLVFELGIDAGALSSAIFDLTMRGLITEHAGRRFKKV